MRPGMSVASGVRPPGAATCEGRTMATQLSNPAELKAQGAENLEAFSGFKLLHVRTQVEELLQLFGREGMFAEYTKHDMSHVDGLLRIYDWLIPDSSKSRMTPADWLLLTLASYLHDFGLLVTRSEFEQRDTSAFPEYVANLKDSKDASNKDYLQQLEALDAEERERFLYQEFVRSNHATRIRHWLEPETNPTLGHDPALVAELHRLLQHLDPVFLQDLSIVCESHHLDDLHDVSKYPLDRPYGAEPDESANVQYVAILLRAADLLHITRDRAPSVAFRVINPANPKSQREWAKHNSVRRVRDRPGVDREGNVDHSAPRDTIAVHANFTNEEGFFGLTSYLQYAQQQIQQCHSWVAHSRARLGSMYEFPWRYIDTDHVRAEGFIAHPFEFQLDQHRILELLTGHTLYNDTSVVVRELTQNAIDAVRLQSLIDNEPGGGDGLVAVQWDPSAAELTFTDNGTGMTQEIVENNFLRVGSSRYQEARFRKDYPQFSPISRFGIGVLSAFMIADDVQVLTCHPEEQEARELSLRSVHGKYLIRLLAKHSDRVPPEIREHGTRVRLRVRPSAELDHVLKVLKRWIVVPEVPVEFRTPGSEPVRVGFATLNEALQDALANSGVAVERDGCFFSRYSNDKIELRTYSGSGIDLVYAVSFNPYLNDYQFLSIPLPRDEDDDNTEGTLGTCVEGIRVTGAAPGYARGGVFAVANARGFSAPRTNVARTGLERTQEYDSFLEKVYRAFSEHLADEIQELATTRGYSQTRAVSEANYLAALLDSEGEPDSREILRRQLAQVPAYLVELPDRRDRRSLAELAEYPELATVDSMITRHLEFFLGAIPVSTSLRRVLEATGASNVQLPDVPMLPLQDSVFTELFETAWHVVALGTDGKGFLEARWARFSGERAWVRSGDPRNVSSELRAVLSRLQMSRRSPGYSGFRNAWHVQLPVTNVPCTGFSGEDDAVSIGGNYYVLPESPFMKLSRATEQGQALSLSRYLIANIIVTILSNHYSPILRGTMFVEDRLVSFVLDALRRSPEACDLLDLDRLQAIAGTSLRVFDVGRWNRLSLF